jgi:transposase
VVVQYTFTCNAEQLVLLIRVLVLGHLNRTNIELKHAGIAGFEELYRSGRVHEGACMSHIRRKFVEQARGQPPDQRVKISQEKAKPVFDDLQARLNARLPRISGKTPLAGAIRYVLTRMEHLRPYLENGFLELDNSTAERSMRHIGMGRKTISSWVLRAAANQQPSPTR